MEFLQALDDALLQGISKEEFAKLWDMELKLKLQKEESRTLELKLACANQMDKCLPENVLEKIEHLIKNHLQIQEENFEELKTSVVKQNQIQYEEIAKLLETQAGLIGQVMRCELDRAVQYLHSGAVVPPVTTGLASYSPKQSNYNYVPAQASNDFIGAENNGRDLHAYQAQFNFQASESKTKQKANPESAQPTKKPQPKKKNKPKTPASIPFSDADIEYLPPDGSELTISDVQQLVTSANCYSTPFYILEDCPCKVRLSLWFGSKTILIVHLFVAGLSDEALPSARIFESVGYIKNKNSGAFSPLFEIVSQPLRKVTSATERQAVGTVCLKTSGGTFKDVTFQELEDRGFIINNSIVIKWVSESFEAN